MQWIILIGWSLKVIDAQRFKHKMTRQAYIRRTCNEYFKKENDVLLLSDERMVMLLVGEWCCWRELCACGHALSGRCEGCCTQV
jgi:hypothetical protein